MKCILSFTFFPKKVHEFSSSMPLDEDVIVEATSNSETESMMDVNGSTKHESLRDTLNHVILAQQSALEILTNLCCDDSNYEECSETDDDEDHMNGKVTNLFCFLCATTNQTICNQIKLKI